jgi:hypothetical protein
VKPPRPAGTKLPRRPLPGVGRAVVLGSREQLCDEDEQHDLPRRLRVRARPGARPEGEDEQGVRIAPHHA